MASSFRSFSSSLDRHGHYLWSFVGNRPNGAPYRFHSRVLQTTHWYSENRSSCTAGLSNGRRWKYCREYIHGPRQGLTLYIVWGHCSDSFRTITVPCNALRLVIRVARMLGTHNDLHLLLSHVSRLLLARSVCVPHAAHTFFFL